MSHFQTLLDEGIEEVFFQDWGETVTRAGESLTVTFDTGVELVDDIGNIEMVSNAIICKSTDDVKFGETFVRDSDDRGWEVGRLLSRSPDERIETYEIVGV